MQQEPTNYHENLFNGAKKSTFQNARNNRKIATEAEEIMWQTLRGKKVDGLKFRRQHPISTFVADFYCHEKQVVIEVDGEYHFQNDQPQHDAWRTDILEDLGITVIRFSNQEVEDDIEKVISILKEILR